MNEELKHLFTPGPMVSFRSSGNISSYLVRAKLYPVESPVGPLIVENHVATFVHILMRQTVLPVLLKEKLTNLIIYLTDGEMLYSYPYL